MRNLCVCIALPFILFAAPSGFKSTHATLVENGATTTIKSGKSAIISWEDFSISKGEHVHFLQDSHKSKVLNRVTGNKLSEIHGTLESNGQVYLINSAGVYVGKTGRINCAAFYASTLEMSDEDFLAGKINTQGYIEGSIRCDGVIDASRIEEVDGKILLLAEETYVNGTLNAKTVHALGDHVHLGEDARITSIAGEVLIGGDKQGQNPDIRNAMNVTVEKGSVVRADAGQIGNGGKVIYWSDQTTAVAGYTSVRGGDASGDGGFVEASGAEILDYTGQSDRRAPHGKCGDLLLDPSNISIFSVPTSGGFFAGTDPIVFYPTVASSVISSSDLEVELAMGNVLIDSSLGSGGVGSVLIELVTITWGTYNTDLRIRAVGSAFIDRSIITNTGMGKFLIVADDSMVFDGAIIENTYSGAGNFDAMDFRMSPGASGGVDMGGPSATCTFTSINGNINVTGYSSGGTGGPPAILLDRTIITTTGTGADAGNISLTGVLGQVGVGPFSPGKTFTISTIDGNIDISGFVDGVGGGLNAVFLPVSPGLITSATGDISITGTSTLVASTSTGIQLGGNIEISSVYGNVYLTGSAVGPTSEGIHFGGGGNPVTTGIVVEMTTGDIEFIGTSVLAEGVGLNQTSTIRTDSGNIDFTGMGNSLSSGFAGNGGGVVLSFGPVVVEATGTGNIDIIGTSTSNTFAQTSGQAGVFITDLSTVSTNSGALTIEGDSVSGSVPTPGVIISTTTTSLETTSGTIDLTGISGTTGIGSTGVTISGVSNTVSVNEGNLTVTGTGSSTAPSVSSGVVVIAATIDATSGTIDITGTGQGTGADNHGVLITGAASITPGMYSTITITGFGSNIGIVANNGIFLSAAGTEIMSEGDVTLNGLARADGLDNNGVLIASGAAISSTVGTIDVNGTGYNDPYGYGVNISHGVLTESLGSVISNTSGAINVTGTSGDATGSYGIVVEGTGTAITNGGAPVTLTGIAPITDKGILINGTSVTTTTGSISLTTFSDIDILSGAMIVGAGPITFDSAKDINVIGDVTPTIIRSTGSDVLLIADANITLLPGPGAAIIDSVYGNNFLVVDNAFPSPAYGIGLGAFSISPGVTLTAGNELRIYTARRLQNSIYPTLLNGAPLMPGPFGLDSATETWLTYFPDGSYGGLAFNIYYKNGYLPPPPPPQDDFVPVSVIGVQLENLLPVIRLQSLWASKGRTNNHHLKFGYVGSRGLDPAFDPYSSFIWEDAVYHTSRRNEDEGYYNIPVFAPQTIVIPPSGMHSHFGDDVYFSKVGYTFSYRFDKFTWVSRNIRARENVPQKPLIVYGLSQVFFIPQLFEVGTPVITYGLYFSFPWDNNI